MEACCVLLSYLPFLWLPSLQECPFLSAYTQCTDLNTVKETQIKLSYFDVICNSMTPQIFEFLKITGFIKKLRESMMKNAF